MWFYAEKWYQKLPFHNRPLFSKLDAILPTDIVAEMLDVIVSLWHRFICILNSAKNQKCKSKKTPELEIQEGKDILFNAS